MGLSKVSELQKIYSLVYWAWKENFSSGVSSSNSPDANARFQTFGIWNLSLQHHFLTNSTSTSRKSICAKEQHWRQCFNPATAPCWRRCWSCWNPRRPSQRHPTPLSSEPLKDKTNVQSKKERKKEIQNTILVTKCENKLGLKARCPPNPALGTDSPQESFSLQSKTFT